MFDAKVGWSVWLVGWLAGRDEHSKQQVAGQFGPKRRTKLLFMWSPESLKSPSSSHLAHTNHEDARKESTVNWKHLGLFDSIKWPFAVGIPVWFSRKEKPLNQQIMCEQQLAVLTRSK